MAGFGLFISIGLSGLLPWVVSGPSAVAFLSPIVIAQIVEYFQTQKPKESPKEPPHGVYTNQEKIESGPQPEPKPKASTKQGRTVSRENSPLEETITVPAKSSRRYQAKLRKDEVLTVEAGAEDWILLEIISRGGIVERSKEGRNLTMQFDAKRNGNWDIYVSNSTKDSEEVGVTLTVEE